MIVKYKPEPTMELLVRNLEKVREVYFSGTKVGETFPFLNEGMHYAFPKALSRRGRVLTSFIMSTYPKPPSLLNYAAKVMGGSYHSEAQGYIYAHSFSGVSDAFGEGNYLKLGVATSIKKRLREIMTDPYAKVRKKRYIGTVFVLPVIGRGLTNDVEQSVLGNLPSDDNVPGSEWWLDPIGVFKHLMRWYAASIQVYKKESKNAPATSTTEPNREPESPQR